MDDYSLFGMHIILNYVSMYIKQRSIELTLPQDVVHYHDHIMSAFLISQRTCLHSFNGPGEIYTVLRKLVYLFILKYENY